MQSSMKISMNCPECKLTFTAKRSIRRHLKQSMKRQSIEIVFVSIAIKLSKGKIIMRDINKIVKKRYSYL